MCLLTATPTQWEALDALVRCGHRKAAAHELGITVEALSHRLRKMRGRSGKTTVQLAAAFGAGDVVIQDTVWPEAA